MATNIISDGETITLAVPYAAGITSGQGMQVGAFLFGVALVSGAQNAAVAVLTRCVARLSKEAPLVISLGDKLWWDNTARVLTKTAGGNIPVGIATAAALSADTTVEVLVGARTPAVAA